MLFTPRIRNKTAPVRPKTPANSPSGFTTKLLNADQTKTPNAFLLPKLSLINLILSKATHIEVKFIKREAFVADV